MVHSLSSAACNRAAKNSPNKTTVTYLCMNLRVMLDDGTFVDRRACSNRVQNVFARNAKSRMASVQPVTAFAMRPYSQSNSRCALNIENAVRKFAFTLIELLVVIAIIAGRAGGRGRGRARAGSEAH